MTDLDRYLEMLTEHAAYQLTGRMEQLPPLSARDALMAIDRTVGNEDDLSRGEVARIRFWTLRALATIGTEDRLRESAESS